MASAIINVIIDGTVVTLLVIYPYSITDTDLKPELLIIKDWFIAFNIAFNRYNLGLRHALQDIDGRLPNLTESYPVVTILVTKLPQYCQCMGLNSRQNDSCVHIYVKNNKLSSGCYDNWLLKNKSNSKLFSAVICFLVLESSWAFTQFLICNDLCSPIAFLNI
ncbi:uncharacterized protein LAESUDRAFT_715000 [Laetiporus sulphureus 93-53]|uniref:Uncharacterized protein n=1 Tax=Laetiporus sulphureus 93-53 TaxID=1314785 RepID=A0A165DMA0_9APHY|nr:uncharacterized protein LAESUDRAFT_715000 [Laetiporus sulphureus 93-53]KZT05188.1 hypothetical protein LAESUDRAFT_715000 [Laetiporus sulphureus 93-53]